MGLERLLGLGGARAPAPGEPIPVDLGPEQVHPIDLRWVDELVAGIRDHVVVRPEDELLIVVPNRPTKLNATALRVLGAMLDEGLDIAGVLAREGDSPRRRRELHWFFADLQDLLKGRLGAGRGRRAVSREPFRADFCKLPVISELALTYRCNLSCAFCYAGCAQGGLPPGWDEARCLDEDAFARVLEIIHRDARCPSVSFTGGEPTTHPGLVRLVRHAVSVGLETNLISNGWLLGERVVGQLSEAGLASAQLSLEGPDAASHDAIVGREGAFERLWRGLESLRRAGVRVHTNTTLSRRNLHLVEPILERVADAGLDRLTMNMVIPCGSAVDPAVQLAYAEMGPVVLAARARAEALGLRFIWYSPLPLCLFNTAAEGLGSPGCAAADGLLHVNPAGEVLPCSSFGHHERLGKLPEQAFEEVWQSRAARWFRGKRMAPPACDGCGQREICQGACPLYWRGLGVGELGGGAGVRMPEGFDG